MGTRKRTARQFQVEAMEPRWTPGGAAGGVIARHIGEEIPQHQVQVGPLGGRGGLGGDVAPTPLGGRGGLGGEV
jgi:hypothetical protein